MAKPKLALIPAAQGTKFYSVLPSDGTGDFTFTRGSKATRINAQGLIETVASGVSRLNYPMIDGVQKGCPHHILEPERTNLVTYSEDLSYFSKTNITEVNGNQVTPNGTIGSIKITPTSSSITQLQKSSLTIGSAYSISFFVKKAEASHLIINQAGSNAQRVSYDIDNLTYIGIAGVDADIVSYGNGWVRIEYSVNSITYGDIRIILSNGTDVYPYNPPVGDGLYLWGFQLEQNSYPTSYIPTNGESGGVTRSAETASGAGQSSTFNDSEGVLMMEASTLKKNGSFENITLSSGTSAYVVLIFYRPTENEVNFRVTVNNVLQMDKVYHLDDVTLFNKMLIKYKQNDFSVYVNGYKIHSDDNGITFASGTLDRINFDSSIGTDDFYGNVKQLQYFDSALADTQLEQLTSWQSFRDMANGQLYTIE